LKTAFIVNSVAASRSATGWRRVEDFINGNGYSPGDVRMTKAVGQATHLAAEAAGSGYEMVVAVGGDGTVNEVLNGLVNDGAAPHPEPVLGIIPLGSGCDLARTLGIRMETTEAIEGVGTNGTKRVDVGRAEFLNLSGRRETRYFMNIADLGAGGLVVQKAIRAPRILGRRPNYFWGILAAALTYKARAVDISVDDGEPVSTAIRNVIIANGEYFGRGFHAAPNARMDDGLFDIVNVGNFGTLEGLWHVPKLYRGTYVGLEKVTCLRGRKVQVDSDEELLIEMDGELVGTLPATFEIVPAAISLAAR